MSNSIALSPEQFIFAQDQELKTDSLKVAEAFNKEHKNILRSINKLISEFTEFAELNFELCTKNNDLQNGKPQPFYEMTKDGFMFLVMGFTGKKASEIKIAYINAFNLMHKKLFPARNALVALPTITPRQQRHIQGVVKKLVNTQVGSTYAIVWGSVKKHFDVGTYKDIPEAKYQDLCTFLKCEPLEGELMPLELQKKYNYPKELALPNNPNGSTIVNAYVILNKKIEAQPLSNLLKELKSDGHDIDGAILEYQLILKIFSDYASGIQELLHTSRITSIIGYLAK